MQTTVIFNRKADARQVSRRLRDYGVLSFVNGREVVIEVTKHGAERDRALALSIYNGTEGGLREASGGTPLPGSTPVPSATPQPEGR